MSAYANPFIELAPKGPSALTLGNWMLLSQNGSHPPDGVDLCQL